MCQGTKLVASLIQFVKGKDFFFIRLIQGATYAKTRQKLYVEGNGSIFFRLTLYRLTFTIYQVSHTAQSFFWPVMACAGNFTQPAATPAIFYLLRQQLSITDTVLW